METRRTITLDLDTHELVHLKAALMTHAQTLHGVSPADAEPAWRALSKVMGVPDARLVVPTRLPTREDTAALIVECELEMSKRRIAAAHGIGPDDPGWLPR